MPKGSDRLDSGGKAESPKTPKGPAPTSTAPKSTGTTSTGPTSTGPKREAKGAERRQHKRVPAGFPLKIVNEAGQEETFRLLDLSECGARIHCAHSVPPMTRIQVALTLPGKGLGLRKDVRVDTTGVIVWCHRLNDAEYDTGVFFPDLQDEQRGMLRALVLATK
jgi:hypothetical protein